MTLPKHHGAIPFFESFNDHETKIVKSLLCDNAATHSYEEILSWFTEIKSVTDLLIEKCNISQLSDWNITNHSISHQEKKYFEVLGVSCQIAGREVAEWCQPIIRQREHGIIGFVLKEINNTYHLLVQAKIEPGNFDVVEMAPTVQCITGSYQNPEYSVEYLDVFTNPESYEVVFDTLQSEEGGRFYHEQNRNIAIVVDDRFPEKVSQNYIWMTFRQAKEFIKFNNYFNIEARSLISCISPI